MDFHKLKNTLVHKKVKLSITHNLNTYNLKLNMLSLLAEISSQQEVSSNYNNNEHPNEPQVPSTHLEFLAQQSHSDNDNSESEEIIAFNSSPPGSLRLSSQSSTRKFRQCSSCETV